MPTRNGLITCCNVGTLTSYVFAETRQKSDVLFFYRYKHSVTGDGCCM